MRRGSRIWRSLVLSVPTLCLCATFVLVATPGQAQDPKIFLAGQLYEGIPAAGVVAKQTPTIYWEGPFGRDLATTSGVGFGRLDADTQFMKLYAWKVPSNNVDFAANAAGRLQLEFCVPVPGASECASPSNPAAPDIPISITFGYGLVGRVRALGLGTLATFQATASVVDVERKTFVSYLKLADLSAARGTLKVIAKIPIPIPAYAGAEVVSPVTFTTLIKRGKLYRFQLSAASYAETAKWPFSFAVSDFSTSTDGIDPVGVILLRNLAIHVSSDLSEVQRDLTLLRDTVTSLQEQVGTLAGQVEALAEASLEETSALRAEIEAIPSGPPGPPGPQGPSGPTGPQGEGLIPGSLLMLPAGSPAPAGYTFMDTIDLAPSDGPRGRSKLWRVDVYVRRAPD